MNPFFYKKMDTPSFEQGIEASSFGKEDESHTIMETIFGQKVMTNIWPLDQVSLAYH